jgi:hypothetical protein
VRRRIAGWVWLRGCDARDAYDLGHLVNTFTPGVFQARFGIHGCFVTFAAQSALPEKLDHIASEVQMLASAARDRMPLAEVEVHDDVLDDA